MMIVPILCKLKSFVSELYDDLTAPKSEAEQCREYLGKVLFFMHRKGGSLVRVESICYSDGKNMAPDIPVNIVYKVEGRKVEGRKKVMVQQQFSYAVDTSSWKSLSRDLGVLGKKFEEAAHKAYGKNHPDIVNFMDEYNLYLKAVKDYAQKANNHHRTLDQ